MKLERQVGHLMTDVALDINTSGRWRGGSRGREHMHTYGWLMLMYGRNQHNIVKHLQLKINKINCGGRLKNILIPITQTELCPPKICMLKPYPQYDCIWWKGLWNIIKVKWDHKGGALIQ